MMFATSLSVFGAYLLVSFIQKKRMRDEPTKKLSRKIFGIVILGFHILLLILNILLAINGEDAGERIFVNISCAIGALFFLK